jgi:hypothetical protein
LGRKIKIPTLAAKSAARMHPADVFRLRKKTFQITSAMYNAKDEYFVVVKAIEDQMFEKSRDRCSSYVPECPSPKCASRTRARTPEYAQNGGTDRLLPSPT